MLASATLEESAPIALLVNLDITPDENRCLPFNAKREFTSHLPFGDL
ncbi:hypothetical protein AVDCRST_MAG92-2654 [uncultured Coleofasciculus sp.]|uniref:Uncharacterized protein n=1 Tax=uncultured Coleofasciculus sp. TaxID=1267456 RepID=A0A6J4IZ31_9CYAN|nr:hypothetical protein AVDCRST_MAG92-2654 [uncultured Coleofasciculus sp.]